jgi:hypothetical protein
MLDNAGWNIIRDKNAMRSGDLISDFIKRIALADHVIVVLSDKYLHSTYCMTELYSIITRAPIADLKRLMDSDPKLGFAFRTVVEKVKNGELTAEDIIVKLSKRKSRAYWAAVKDLRTKIRCTIWD